MKKIPIVLEQYECDKCKKKWYINTSDKTSNEMTCPYGCECPGKITRKFDMVIHSYEEYVQTDKFKDREMTLDGEEDKFKGGEE